ncbi:MAG: hypothetical protein H6733_07850 [Alphaproteobacteria bacterium]|nr:hypothetical protein [Alphaproteobacteria bacterium]
MATAPMLFPVYLKLVVTESRIAPLEREAEALRTRFQHDGLCPHDATAIEDRLDALEDRLSHLYRERDDAQVWLAGGR